MASKNLKDRAKTEVLLKEANELLSIAVTSINPSKVESHKIVLRQS